MLQWNRPTECQNAVIVLGGFHTQMNVSKAIGQYMADSGLADLWVETGVHGQNTAETILQGKMWNRVIAQTHI